MSEILTESVQIRSNRSVHIYFTKNSRQNKTLFFFHGLGGRAEQWYSEINFFKDQYNIVAADMLGHGQSQKPYKNADFIYSFKELSSDTQAVFDHYATEENFIIGHSYGGALAANLSMKNVKTIKKLILITPLALKPNHSIPKVFFLPSRLLELIRPLLTRQFIKLAFHPSTDQSIIVSEIKAGRCNPMYVLKALTLGMKNIPKKNIHHIKQSTLIVLVENDGLTPEKYIRHFYRDIPSVEFKKIENAGHMVIIEQPEELNQSLKAFLEK